MLRFRLPEKSEYQQPSFPELHTEETFHTFCRHHLEVAEAYSHLHLILCSLLLPFFFVGRLHEGGDVCMKMATATLKG